MDNSESGESKHSPQPEHSGDERSAELYHREDLARIDRVLRQPNFAPRRKPFSIYALLGIFVGVTSTLAALAWVAANLML